MAADEARASTTGGGASKVLISLTASRPEYLRRVWERRVSESGRYEWPSLSSSETADIRTVDQAWERLVGQLTPSEWLDLGGPEELPKIIRYLDPDEMHNIRGPYAVKGDAERNRLGTLLWRRLVLEREAARSR
jgi:hypothetical protein